MAEAQTGFNWADVLGPLIGAGASIYGANQSSNAAQTAATSTRPNPYSGFSELGTTAFDPSTGSFAINPNSNPFQALFEQLGMAGLSNAGSANSMPYLGANPELIQALTSANNSTQPGSPEFMDVLSKLRAIGAPQEQRDNVSLDNQQFANGTLGTTGGAERFRALKEAQGQTDLQRQLSAQGITTQNANQRFSNALTTVNQGMANQQQQFNIGSGSNSANMNAFQQLLQQLGIGVSAGGGTAPGAAVFAAQQAGAVPQTIAQIANSDAFGSVLKNIGGFMRRQGPVDSTDSIEYT